jgi:hypothetical protein
MLEPDIAQSVRVTLEFVPIIDCSMGFGHTDLFTPASDDIEGFPRRSSASLADDEADRTRAR